MILAAAGRIIDGRGDLSEVTRTKALLDSRGLRTEELRIAQLRAPWREPLPPGYLRGATAPLQAIAIARTLFDRGEADALLLTGTDHLRSDYAPEERKSRMQVFAGARTHLDGYALLVEKFIESTGISRENFHTLAECLFQNYRRTCRDRSLQCVEPEARWFGFVNEYFRGVDCANPYVDFTGAIIIVTDEAAELCQIPADQRVRVLACELREAGSDTIEGIPSLVQYDHLATAYEAACRDAGLDFSRQFLQGNALLEVYTCYPVVALAFLLRSGLVDALAEVPELLRRHNVTVTGGLNLGRAPWNNTTLNAMIAMTELLRTPGAAKVAGVHSNGSLGYQQGFVLLGREDGSRAAGVRNG